MTFVASLAHRFNLEVEMDADGCFRLSTPPPANEAKLSKFVPHVFQIDDSGRAVPVNYELPSAGSKHTSPL
jgi:hypothetical protein